MKFDNIYLGFYNDRRIFDNMYFYIYDTMSENSKYKIVSINSYLDVIIRRIFKINQITQKNIRRL